MITKEEYKKELDKTIELLGLKFSEKFEGRYIIETYKGDGYVSRFKHSELLNDNRYKQYLSISAAISCYGFFETLLNLHIHEDSIDENNELKEKGTSVFGHLTEMYSPYLPIEVKDVRT